MKTFIEASNGLMAKLVDKSKYDGLWISSLCHSATKGLPDSELVPLKERVDLTEELCRLTNKPIIVDIDTGENIEHLPFLIRWFQKAGAYAVIMEDKKYPKQNSLLEDANQLLEDIDIFSQKIRIAKKNAGEMKVFARLESLIAEKSINDGLIRANAYIEAGADGIMVHSKEKINAEKLMDLATQIRNKFPEITMIAVPTTYNLPIENPFDIVITANHLTRVSLKAMQRFLAGEEVEMASVQDLFDIVGY